MKENTEEKIKNIIANKLGVEKDKVNLDSHFVSDLNVAPLEIPKLISSLEEEFEIEIPKEETKRFLRVIDIVHFVQDNIIERE